MHEAAAVWTKTAQVSPRSGHRKIIDQSTVRTAWRLASKTPKLIRTARRLPPVTALFKKAAQFLPVDQDLADFVDWLEALTEPVRDRVLVNPERCRCFSYRVAAVKLDYP